MRNEENGSEREYKNENWRNIYSTSATTIYTIIIVIKAQEIIVIL